MVQNLLLEFDGKRYRLFVWVVMPNHVHSLMTRFESYDLSDIVHSLKSYSAHESEQDASANGTILD
jgi:REP element-mobilizing transposase RayT